MPMWTENKVKLSLEQVCFYLSFATTVRLVVRFVIIVRIHRLLSLVLSPWQRGQFQPLVTWLIPWLDTTLLTTFIQSICNHRRCALGCNPNSATDGYTVAPVCRCVCLTADSQGTQGAQRTTPPHSPRPTSPNVVPCSSCVCADERVCSVCVCVRERERESWASCSRWVCLYVLCVDVSTVNGWKIQC